MSILKFLNVVLLNDRENAEFQNKIQNVSRNFLDLKWLICDITTYSSEIIP